MSLLGCGCLRQRNIEGGEQAGIQFNNNVEMQDATKALSWQLNITRLNNFFALKASRGLLIACFPTSVDVLCVSRVLPHLFYGFIAYGNVKYLYTVLHISTLTPVLCYYGFPFHPVFQLDTHVGRMDTHIPSLMLKMWSSLLHPLPSVKLVSLVKVAPGWARLVGMP